MYLKLTGQPVLPMFALTMLYLLPSHKGNGTRLFMYGMLLRGWYVGLNLLHPDCVQEKQRHGLYCEVRQETRKCTILVAKAISPALTNKDTDFLVHNCLELSWCLNEVQKQESF